MVFQSVKAPRQSGSKSSNRIKNFLFIIILYLGFVLEQDVCVKIFQNFSCAYNSLTKVSHLYTKPEKHQRPNVKRQNALSCHKVRTGSEKNRTGLAESWKRMEQGKLRKIRESGRSVNVGKTTRKRGTIFRSCPS